MEVGCGFRQDPGHTKFWLNGFAMGWSTKMKIARLYWPCGWSQSARCYPSVGSNHSRSLRAMPMDEKWM